MKVLKKEESREQCSESGWHAYDYIFEQPLQTEQIQRLQQLGGNFLYLKQLKHPFFKVEQKYMMLKGIQGSQCVRLAVFKEQEERICKEAETLFENL